MSSPVDESPQPVTLDTAPPPRSSRKKRRPVGTWLALGFIAVLIALVGSTLRGGAFVYAKYVDEVTAQRAHWVGRTVRIEGLVAPASIENRPGADEYRFRVARNHAVIQVHYRGVVPDTFRDCAGVTVRGVLQSSGTFEADEIVAKCPSKYEAATVVNGECVVGVSPGAATPPRL